MYQTTHGKADEWTGLCWQFVPRILRQRDWQLVSEDELPRFVRDVGQVLSDGTIHPAPGATPEATVNRATIHRYCHELYRASGEAGSARQRRAFVEIGRHAQGVAYRFEQNPDVAQQCAQHAVEIVWEKREQVRQPGSFLRWIETIVFREIKGYWRNQQCQREVSMSELALPEGREDDEGAIQHFWDALSSLPPPEDELVARELREELWAGVRRALADNPRYEAVIVGYFYYGLPLPTLAGMLQTPVRNVYVLKSRALSRLRTNEGFMELLADALRTLAGGEP